MNSMKQLIEILAHLASTAHAELRVEHISAAASYIGLSLTEPGAVDDVFAQLAPGSARVDPPTEAGNDHSYWRRATVDVGGMTVFLAGPHYKRELAKGVA